MAPYPISITAYDTDNTTALASAQAVVRNVSKNLESDTITLNASGQAIYDLANIGFANGDFVQISVWKGDKAGFDRHTVNTGVGSYDSTVYASILEIYRYSCKIQELTASNESASVADVSVYDVATDTLKHKARIPANDSKVFRWRWGLHCAGGFVVIRSVNTLIVTVNVK